MSFTKPSPGRHCQRRDHACMALAVGDDINRRSIISISPGRNGVFSTVIPGSCAVGHALLGGLRDPGLILPGGTVIERLLLRSWRKRRRS